MKVNLYNTFNLVVPLLDELLPVLNRGNISAKAYVCAEDYRVGASKANQNTHLQRFKVPGIIAKSKLGLHIWYFFRAAWHVLFAGSNLNVFFTQPPFFFIAGGLLSRFRGQPYVVHVMDLHPEMFGRLGLLKQDSLVYRALEAAAAKTFRRAAHVVVLGECMKRLLVAKGVAPERIQIIRNIPTVSRSQEIAEELSSMRKFTVLYAGNMGRPHEFKTILRAARKLYIDEPAVCFRFVGQGARRREIEVATASGALPNVELSPSLPMYEFKKALSEASLHFVSLRDQFEGVLVPSKFFSSVAMGKPVLFEGPEGCDIAQDIKSHGLGAVVEHGDEIELVAAIRSYYERRTDLPTEERRITECYKNIYQKQDAISEYVKLIEGSINENR